MKLNYAVVSTDPAVKIEGYGNVPYCWFKCSWRRVFFQKDEQGQWQSCQGQGGGFVGLPRGLRRRAQSEWPGWQFKLYRVHNVHYQGKKIHGTLILIGQKIPLKKRAMPG